MDRSKDITDNTTALRQEVFVDNVPVAAILSYNIHSDHLNYGAALHSFAFQQYLMRLGRRNIVINYKPKTIRKRNLKYPILNVKLKGLGHHLLNWGCGFFSNIRKYNKFHSFFEKHLVKTCRKYTYKDMLTVNSIENLNIDTFVCESDVIWKRYKWCPFDPVFYLSIPSATGKKKVAYAPTLSSRPFPEDEEGLFLEYVSRFDAVSARERQGAEYLTRLLNRKIEWVLDPTLLLTCDDYNKIAVEPKESGYVLLYNCMRNDKAMVKEAQKLADRLGLNLIEISNFYENRFSFQHTIKTDVGIEEWLGYFKAASFVVCNAFHGFCFSVIYKKPVFLFERDGSDFRMKNITEALGMGNRLIPYNDKHIPHSSYSEDIAWGEVYEKLEQLRTKSHAFIKKHIID